METFMLLSPHSVPSVCKVQTISELIGEQNWNPIILCPSHMIFSPIAPASVELSVGLKQLSFSS
jgi:hypothetical protein